MTEEQNRPLIGGGFWFAITALGLAFMAYDSLPRFFAEVPPAPIIDVRVDKEMLQEAVEEALPEVFELGAISGAKAYYIILKKGVSADKITIQQIVNGARLIRKSVQKEAKVTDGTGSEPKSADKSLPGLQNDSASK